MFSYPNAVPQVILSPSVRSLLKSFHHCHVSSTNKTVPPKRCTQTYWRHWTGWWRWRTEVHTTQQRIHPLTSSELWSCHMKLYITPRGLLADLELRSGKQKTNISLRQCKLSGFHTKQHKNNKAKYLQRPVVVPSAIHLWFSPPSILTSVIKLCCNSSSYYGYSPHAESNAHCTTGAWA